MEHLLYSKYNLDAGDIAVGKTEILLPWKLTSSSERQIATKTAAGVITVPRSRGRWRWRRDDGEGWCSWCGELTQGKPCRSGVASRKYSPSHSFATCAFSSHVLSIWQTWMFTQSLNHMHTFLFLYRFRVVATDFLRERWRNPRNDAFFFNFFFYFLIKKGLSFKKLDVYAIHEVIPQLA